MQRPDRKQGIRLILCALCVLCGEISPYGLLQMGQFSVDTKHIS